MHAVIRTGGKQYYVTAGEILEVEKVAGNVGDTIALADVLLLAGDGTVTVGQPVVSGASVLAKITGQHRGQKIQVFRYRPKKRIRVRKGHRQYLTRLEIQSIRLADGTEFPSAPMAAEPEVVETVAEPILMAEDRTDVEPAANDNAVPAEFTEPIVNDADSTDVEQVANDSAVPAESENTAKSENKE